MKRRAWLLYALPLLAAPLHAVTVGPVQLPDSQRVDGQTLLLNGAGLRKYGVFGIDVYAAALYLPARTASEHAALDGDGPKLLLMQFLRDVSRDDSAKAWAHYLAGNCGTPCGVSTEAMARFTALVPASVKGQTQTFVFRANGLDVYGGSQLLGHLPEPALARLVLASWIGPVPTTVELKRALLGAATP